MEKIWIGIIVGCMLISSSKAQTIKEIFIASPDVMLLPLSANNRMDLIDLYMGGQDATVSNSLGDKVVLNYLTDNYLRLQSGNAVTEMFFLTLINESQIIGLIQTVGAPVCDSRPEFYSLKWKKLDADLFISPAEKSRFMEDTTDFPFLDIELMEFHYDAEKQCLLQTYNTPDYVSPEDKETLPLNVREKTKIYQWNGIRFE
jgi:hypothetical protein